MSKYQSITIRKALEGIHGGHLLLPAFQRDFVWKHEQVEMLFDSLMRGYPISGMLFWKLREDSGRKYRFYRFLSSFTERFKTRSEEVKPYLSHADFAVLDGQQRLTALNIGLCGTYAYRKKYAWERLSENNYPTRRLYLDISRRYDDDEDGRMYHFEFVAGHDEDLFADGERLWLRCSVALECDKARRREFARENGLTAGQSDMLDDLWDMIWERETISYYEEDTDDPDVAVDVFSRINSGGTRLPMSDILMAMTVASWQERNAREEIDGLVDDVNRMGFYIGRDFVLKAMLYVMGKDVRFRIGNFDNDFIRECEVQWLQLREAMVAVFALVKGFGLDHGTLTTYHAVLPMMYYLYWSSRYKGIVDAVMYEGERLIMRNWLLKSVLLRTFGYRQDGALRRSRQVLSGGEWRSFPAIELEQALGQQVSEESFFDTLLSCQWESRQSWVILSLLYSHRMMEGVRYAMDHLHPRAAWSESLCPWEEYNSVVNLQMLPEKKNLDKSDMALEDWVSVQCSELRMPRETFIHTLLVPDVDLAIWNWREFYEARKQMLVKVLKDVMRV